MKLLILVFSLLLLGVVGANAIVPVAASKTYSVSPTGNDAAAGTPQNPFQTIQRAIDVATPGDTIELSAGEYLQDFVTKKSGTKDALITIRGPEEAIIKGAGGDRVIEINHDFIALSGFTVDGLHGSPTEQKSYRDKLIFLLGKLPLRGPTGVRITKMTIKNAGGECIRLRYYVSFNEIAENTIQNCGIYDFVFNAGGKNGEGIYIGTAPEQTGDGKNPTPDIDASNSNWIHHNTFNTQGNECVDIKEGSLENIVEYNSCTGQKDMESAGFDARGNLNIFRYNQSFGNLGSGIRLGGDTPTDGIGNVVYGNTITKNSRSGIKIQRSPQGVICDNTLTENRGGNTSGNFGSNYDPTTPCPEDIAETKLQAPTASSPFAVLSPEETATSTTNATNPFLYLFTFLSQPFSLVVLNLKKLLQPVSKLSF